MARLRITFMALAGVLTLSLGLLVWRAVESLRAERDLRHQIVAERVFDEMERELTELVRREEDRPFEHYRSHYVPESSVSQQALVRSPLADPPAESFIVGYFLVSPEGALSTPREDASAEDLTRLQTLVAGRDKAPLSEAQARAQSPGTTLALSKTERQEEVVADDESSSSGSYLRELNRGAAMRRDRDTKLSQSAATNVLPYDAAERASYRQEAFSELDDVAYPTPVDVVLDSLVGERVDERFLVLARNATVGEAIYRQGLVLETDALIDELEQRVLSGSELVARFEIAPESRARTRFRQTELTYRHQFAEPFDGLASLLALPPLPDGGGASFTYLLSAIAFAAGAVGLIGVYRMVSTRIAFAERRQNFVSAVSHELKTPLTAIRMYGEMLRDGMVPDEEKRQHYYGVITSESERLTRLVNNVLELSKLERRDSSVSAVAGPLLPVLEEAKDVLLPHAAREGFEIRLQVEPGLPEAIYDRDTLLQVLFNLIDNAVKYSKNAARREVTLSARRLDDALEIAVSDQGPGVQEVHLRRIFEPFYRAEAEMTRQSKGTGIGLALVRGLVESMGGSVRGENDAGGGFVVRLTLQQARNAF